MPDTKFVKLFCFRNFSRQLQYKWWGRGRVVGIEKIRHAKGGRANKQRRKLGRENIDKMEIKWKMNKKQKTEANRKKPGKTGGTQEILLFFI